MLLFSPALLFCVFFPSFQAFYSPWADLGVFTGGLLEPTLRPAQFLPAFGVAAVPDPVDAAGPAVGFVRRMLSMSVARDGSLTAAATAEGTALYEALSNKGTAASKRGASVPNEVRCNKCGGCSRIGSYSPFFPVDLNVRGFVCFP